MDLKSSLKLPSYSWEDSDPEDGNDDDSGTAEERRAKKAAKKREKKARRKERAKLEQKEKEEEAKKEKEVSSRNTLARSQPFQQKYISNPPPTPARRRLIQEIKNPVRNQLRRLD
jgi:hypothetical protein